MIDANKIKDAERIVRITMILILLTAGTSKLFSGGGFFDYYSALFQGDLRIHLPTALVDAFLHATPWVELLIGLALFSTRHKAFVVYAWFAFMLCLMFGHYVLQEWSAVNDMLDYVFLGILCQVLPSHRSWFARDVG